MTMRGQYLVAKPREEKEEPKAPALRKLKARIREYRLLGYPILVKIEYLDEIEV